MNTTTPQDTREYAELFALFSKAATTLRYPAISFTLADTRKCRLYLATKGYIAVKIEGEYTGKIPDAGHSLILYNQSKEIWNEIRQFCLSPISQSQIKGRKYGYCCFCGRDLDNASSVFHGYGPICADKYGLPWGDRPSTEKPEKTAIELPDL